jgi:ADP-heptose:LPS heptosyltransferase
MPGKKHKHILVIRLSAMGDVAITVPVLRALTQQHPNVKVTVVSRGHFRPFFDGLPNVYFFEPDLKRRHKGFWGILKLYKDLRKLHIHAVADLHNVLRSKIVTFLFSLRGKKTATTNKLRSERAALTALKADKTISPLPPVSQRHADVFAQLGYLIDVNAGVFPPKQPLTEDITDVSGPKTGRWIGIAPFAQHKGKVYPKDLMQQVIDSLSAEATTTLFLFGGGRNEAKLLDDFAQNRPNIIVVAGGSFILKQELKLISNLDVMLSMDSGNAHMAAMLGVPVVTLWGATHPYAGFAPFKQPLSNALTANRQQYPMLPTSIYGNTVVEGYEDAMRTIVPQTVVDKVNEVII